MTTSVIIRRARTTDIRAIRRLGKATPEFKVSAVERFYLTDEMQEFLRKPKESVFLVAIEEKNVVGFLHARIITKHWCLLDAMVVAPKRRGSGVGKKLLATFYAILKKQGVDFVHGYAGCEHKRTRAFWKKQGMTEGKKFVWFEKDL